MRHEYDLSDAYEQFSGLSLTDSQMEELGKTQQALFNPKKVEDLSQLTKTTKEETKLVEGRPNKNKSGLA